MNLDMAFESVLVSEDQSVVEIMTKLLADMAIVTKVRPSTGEAVDLLLEGGTDLIIVDGHKECGEILRHRELFGRNGRPIVVVISESESARNALSLRKPITIDSGRELLLRAYSRLLRDYRRHRRYAVVISLIAVVNSRRPAWITITNIGEGGLGLNTHEHLVIGDLLYFRLLLPGTESAIRFVGRVLWKRHYGMAGCSFTEMSQADRALLTAWLDNRCAIKKPLIECDSDARNRAAAEFTTPVNGIASDRE